MNISSDKADIDVALYFFGETLDLSALNALFNVDPIAAIAKGDPRLRRSNGEVLGVYTGSTWGFSSSQAIRSNEIDQHADWILSRADIARKFLKLSPKVEAFVEVSLGWNSSCALPKRLVAFAAEMKADVGVVAGTY
jgi:Domain of unknown function (DUF4279)